MSVIQIICVLKTRFQLILPVDSDNVTKNRTDHRMHVEGPQICQINRWNNSFQNMYGMNRQQLTVWPGKSILCQKNTSFSPILVDTNLSYLTLERPGRQTVDTRSTSGVPLKTFGYDGTEIREKVIFWANRSIPEKFQQENFSGPVPMGSFCTQIQKI